MTKPLVAGEVAERITRQLPDTVVESDKTAVFVKSESVAAVCRFLYDTDGLAFDYLSNLTGVDYLGHIEIIYHLDSLKHNHSLVLKTRCYDREKPAVPSVTPIWRGADFQEREVHDLLGVRFEGHHNLKPIVLWEGFEGYPLRRDFL